MNRREFTLMAPVAAAAVALEAKAQQTVGKMPEGATSDITSDVFPGFVPPEQFTGRSAHSFFHGMLPTNIGCEVHVSYLAPNAEHEKEEKHLHSEMWLVRQGTIELHLAGVAHVLHAGDTAIAVAGTMHYVKNIGADVASYFVVKAGTGPLLR